MTQFPAMRSTMISNARSRLPINKNWPDKIGQYSKRVDKALPGKHTKDLYDQLSCRETSVLIQFRTGMARLNEFLHRIGAARSDQCACGSARETVDHFLFRCIKWTEQRKELLQCTTTQRGNLSFFLGGKAASDKDNWKPNMQAVRATIKFAMATGRLDTTMCH